MKKVFDDEVANELGYQKYSPELHDWIFAVVGVLGCYFLFVGIILLIVFGFN